MPCWASGALHLINQISWNSCFTSWISWPFLVRNYQARYTEDGFPDAAENCMFAEFKNDNEVAPV